jgi:cell division protein FtsN
MARTSRKSSKSRSGGSTLFGVLTGLILGLGAAVAVALFVTKVPMPFIDKATRDPAKTLLPDVRDAPDPNIGLYGQNSPGGVPPMGPTATAPAPLPGVASGKAPASMSDDISALIASLDEQPAAPAKATTPPAPAAAAPAAKKDPAAKPASTQTTYYLQAGAFRSENDAEAIKAQILLMGLPVQVQKAQINGATINRVRVGPFKGIDEMNRSRVRLGEAKIASSVVRP